MNSNALLGAARSAVAAAALCAVAGCALIRLAPPVEENLAVDTVVRAINCGTPSRSAGVHYFPDADSFLGWDRVSAVLAGGTLDDDVPRDQPMALLEMGKRNSGGYFLTVEPEARLDTDRVLHISATWTEPGADRLVTQALTSPCVLLRLTPRDYAGLRVSDQQGELRASTRIDQH